MTISNTPLTKRTSRIRMAGAIAAGLGMLLASACSSQSSSSQPTGGAAPTDHVLKLSFLQDPGQPPDPDIYYAGQGLLLTNNTYQGLLQYQPGTAQPKIISNLATSWKASKNNSVFTFQLRHGVTFHDGTPFTSAAVKASFDRRLAVNSGPAYMVQNVKSVTAQGSYGVTVTLKQPNAQFPDYMASPYGPKMMSPTGLAQHAGKDHTQTYLRTHDLGTGPYQLTEAKTGSQYQLTAYAKYWGAKPYFTTVDLPVVADTSTQQLLLNKGDLAAVLHDLPQSAVQSYRKSKALKSYSLPSMISDFLYVNPHNGMLANQANRQALLQAVNVDQIYNQVFAGRAQKASQAYPANVMAPSLAKQNIPYSPSALQKIVQSLPASQRTLTVGYDSSQSDNQVVANLLSAQLANYGVTVKVQSYPTSQIFGWVTNLQGAPDMLLTTGWPDAAPPYMWAHISYVTGGGLNYFQCSTPQLNKLVDQGLSTGSTSVFSQVGQLAAQSGCWDNLINEDDFMVAQPWLKGVAESHVVSTPATLNLATLSVG
jgi:peptide/nickel transport system substrate-binding protein